MKFEIVHTSKKSRARVGKIHTPHGIIHTPSFVAVGTNAAIKALDSVAVNSLELDLLFCNTYHLLIQPGPKVIKEAGGLHKFMKRSRPIITDSGGFQVFSLAYGSVASELKSQGMKKSSGTVLKITEEGVTFRSYRDGKKILLTPENSVETQKDLGADIIIPLDELPPYHISKTALKESLDRTHRWEIRSLETHLANPKEQAMYAVVHGGIDPAMREESLSFLRKHPFDGFSIGGSLGKTRDEMAIMLDRLTPLLPPDKPNHLLGIADLPSLNRLIPFGIDTFDSSYPTKAARHGVLLTKSGPLKIVKETNASNYEAPDPTCSCTTCQNYSLAYLNHLFRANELVGLQLATVHNLAFMVNFMQEMREDILNDKV
ncbi:MAG: tRNA-guanosine(34) transglycosylase [Verrucomicrobia bacterium]|nr:tRNA-guanosine(34) transglycosylase [Verrucomicrobiota bacterium]